MISVGALLLLLLVICIVIVCCKKPPPPKDNLDEMIDDYSDYESAVDVKNVDILLNTDESLYD